MPVCLSDCVPHESKPLGLWNSNDVKRLLNDLLTKWIYIPFQILFKPKSVVRLNFLSNIFIRRCFPVHHRDHLVWLYFLKKCVNKVLISRESPKSPCFCCSFFLNFALYQVKMIEASQILLIPSVIKMLLNNLGEPAPLPPVDLTPIITPIFSQLRSQWQNRSDLIVKPRRIAECTL